MTLFDPPLEPDDPARLRLEAGRTCDRLRSMSLTRLGASVPDGRSRARAAFDLAQVLADGAGQLAGRGARMLPELPDSSAGDVLAVCSEDLAEAVESCRTEASGQACREAVAALVALRLLL